MTTLTACLPAPVLLLGQLHSTQRHQQGKRSQVESPSKQYRTPKRVQLPLQCSASSSCIHIALSVENIDASILDYSERLKAKPCAIVSGQYALWRTRTVNFSIRQAEPPGVLRHLGCEDSAASAFTEETDCNGLTWEHFSAQQQAQEINDIWPEAQYKV